MEQIVVSKHAGLLDTLYALGRYFIVIVGAVPLLLKLLGARDLVGLIAYFQSADGAALVAAVSAVAALAFGLFKSFRRGRQVADVAANPKVPDRIATLKE